MVNKALLKRVDEWLGGYAYRLGTGDQATLRDLRAAVVKNDIYETALERIGEGDEDADTCASIANEALSAATRPQS